MGCTSVCARKSGSKPLEPAKLRNLNFVGGSTIIKINIVTSYMTSVRGQTFLPWQEYSLISRLYSYNQ